MAFNNSRWRVVSFSVVVMAGLALLVLLRLGCPENEADERGHENGANEGARDNVERDLDFTHGWPRFP